MNGNHVHGKRCVAAMIVGFSFFAADAARGQSSVYGTIDPYQYARPAGAPAVSVMSTWQTDPFNVGYNLLGGYRPLYSGAAQPIGHEIIETHGGNGYVYRPVYGAQPFYAPQHFGSYGVVVNRGSSGSGRALVIENPGTPYETRYSSAGGYGGHAALIDVMPHLAPLPAAPQSYAAPTTYEEQVQGTAVQLPNGDIRLADGTVIPAADVKPAPAEHKREF